MGARGMDLQLATRGSDLARRQASMIRDNLETRRIDVSLVEVDTTGDEIRDELIHRLGTTGAFVRSLDEKVLSGELHGSIHSMKDMPTEQPAELVVAGVPERGPPGDVLVTPDGSGLDDLPTGATVGTSSLRRGAQLREARPDLEIEPLRGNVDTRVAKLLAPTLQREHERRLSAAKDADTEGDAQAEAGGERPQANEAGTDSAASGDQHEQAFERTPAQWTADLSEIERRALERDVDTEYDAICLAAAGLARSGLIDSLGVTHLDPTEFVPAPAQGAIAVTARDGSTAERIHDRIDHPPTRVEVTVERTVLGELGGGCVAPVGVFARLQGAVVTTTVRVLSRDGTEEVTATRELPVEQHGVAATELAADLADRGAATLVEQARRDEPDEAKRA